MKNLTLMKKLRDPAVVIVKTYHCKDGEEYQPRGGKGTGVWVG
jgi:hypothetical protein